MPKNSEVDKIFLFSIMALLIFGFAVFISASMGLLVTNSAEFSSIAFKQAFFGVILGLLACFIFSKVSYKVFKKYAFFIFLASLIATCTVFIPHIGVRINGARRWIVIAGLSVQPVAFLNIGFVTYWAAWLSSVKGKVSEIKYGLLPLLSLLGIVGIPLLLQPDTDSFIIICLAGILMFLIAGGKVRHILLLFLIGVIVLAVIAFSRPYVMSRIETFMHPANNVLTSGYQVEQSEIAIGSGEVFGRGFGQSIQKYDFLPESITDSIFAVLGEELGFVGCVIVIGLLLFFIFRGFRIGVRAPDTFSGLLTLGIVIIIGIQSFVNIGSTIGVVPFSGIPLAFFSQGGTSMLAMLAQLGVILNISKYVKKTP